MRKSELEGLLRRALGLIDQVMQMASRVAAPGKKEFIKACQFTKDDIEIALKRLKEMG